MSNQTRDYGDLTVTMTSAYDWIWGDNGSGAARNGCFWHPKPQGGLRPLGDVAIGNYNDINGQRATLLVGANPNRLPQDGKSAVASPTGYTQIWRDEGSGADNDGSFWRPIAPSGYVALGDVAQQGWGEPDKNRIWCLRADLTLDARFAAESVWDDYKSGADNDVSIWETNLYPTVGDGSKNIPILAGTFRSNQSHSGPETSFARVPVLQVEKSFRKFAAPLPEITPDNLPTTGDTFEYQEQCSVMLPFVAFFPPTDRPSLDNIRNPFCAMSRSIAWYVLGVYENPGAGTITRTETVKTGVSDTASTEMQHSTGVLVSATAGIGLASYSVTLNYQFTYTTSNSTTEFKERTITEEVKVPAHYVSVLFSKHVWFKAIRTDSSSTVMGQIDFNIGEDLHVVGVSKEK